MNRLATALCASASILLPDVAGACPALTHTVPEGAINALSRGFNADGWINGSQTAPPLQLLVELRKAGMTHVRLPVPAEHIMSRFAPRAEQRTRLDAVDAAVAKLISLGYHVSIDLHAGEKFNRLHREQPATAVEAIKGAWSDLAQIVRRHPTERIFAELLNEPDLDAETWQRELEELALYVRGLLPRTTLIVGPVNWQRADSLPGFKPLDDSNVVYAVHFYDPMVFTHQAHWDPTDPLHEIRGLPYPLPRADDPDVQKIRRRLLDDNNSAVLAKLDRAIPDRGIGKWLEPAAVWQAQFSRPIIINEFGVLKAGAPRESRLRWLSSVASYAEQHCWGWAHWELSQGFGLVDDKSGKADAGVLKALLGNRGDPARTTRSGSTGEPRHR